MEKIKIVLRHTSLAVLFTLAGFATTAQSHSEQVAVLIEKQNDSSRVEPGDAGKWNYQQGLVMEGMELLWKRTANSDYFDYIQKNIDRFVDKDGNIRTGGESGNNFDNTAMGPSLLMLFKVTGQKKYLKAAESLYQQWKKRSGAERSADNSFTNEMRLDGSIIAQPFYAEYASLINDERAFEDIAIQLMSIEQSRDPKTGLLYQSSNRTEKLAAETMGWYSLALVNMLDNFPASHPKRGELINILIRTAAAIKGNHFESLESGMFVYALAKGVRNGYLPVEYIRLTKKGYASLKKRFTGKAVGGKPNDSSELAAFLLASEEMELAAIPKPGTGKLVLLDNYFNNEYRKSALDGTQERFHYQWDELDANGYSFFAQAFTFRGVKTATLHDKPTSANLAEASVYIIVDPDTEKETEKPNFIAADDITIISSWVKNGGVLVLLGNDLGNAEFAHFNKLTATFGMHFIEQSVNKVPGSEYEKGVIEISKGNEIFKTAKKAYIKELSGLQLSGPAKVALKKGDDVIVATAKYGKGMVLAAGDPWFYNEYTDGRKDYPDGRKLPKDYENYKAANDLAQWLLQHANNSKK